MLRALIDLGRKSGLHQLTAEVVAEQTKVIKAFQNVGFQVQCTYDDYFMFPDGDTRCGGAGDESSSRARRILR